MNRAAVICEFNPFHNGHKFLLEKIKSEYADEIICIMSGSFVQRGDLAITDKFTRAAAALHNGADMVVELPTAYALGSAGVFAQGGVRLAKALGCDLLCFGAESSQEELMKLAAAIDSEAVNSAVSKKMKAGCYYPKALGEAVKEHLGDAYAELIALPNNILALEYIKACRAADITPLSLERRGAAHDSSAPCGHIASASYLRELIRDKKPYADYTPMAIPHPCLIGDIEPAILYALKTASVDKLAALADVSEGLENRIADAAKHYNSLEELLKAVKTKRYTHARLRRILLCALLGITKERQGTPVPYVRVLGLREGSSDLLGASALPLIVKVRADYERLDNSAKEIFDIDLRATEAMNIAKKADPLNEFTQAIIKI